MPFSGFHLNGWELAELSRFYFNGVALGVYPQTEKNVNLLLAVFTNYVEWLHRPPGFEPRCRAQLNRNVRLISFYLNCHAHPRQKQKLVAL